MQKIQPPNSHSGHLSPKALDYLAANKARNTIIAYNSDWRDFAAWCKARNILPLPADADDVANYLSELADRVSANTVARHLTAISTHHKSAGYAAQNPAQNVMIKMIMYAIKRRKGTGQRGKSPITPSIIARMAPHFADNLPGVRNKALILVGFAGALRRSELVALQVPDIQWVPQGLIITIQKSKTDPIGQGQKITIPYATNRNTCPVLALRRWLDTAGIADGYIFRGIMPDGRIKPTALDGRMVALIIKHYAEAAGLDATQYAGHSLRRGFATSAARAHVGVLSIMRQTRHKSESMVYRYVAEGAAFEQNPLPQIWDCYSKGAI